MDTKRESPHGVVRRLPMVRMLSTSVVLVGSLIAVLLVVLASGQATATELVQEAQATQVENGRIAFDGCSGDCAGRYQEIYVMNADGSGLHRITNNKVYDGQPAWSPSGKKIAFVSGRDGDKGIFTMNADGSNKTKLVSNGRDPDWSPDGRKIAFAAGHSSYIDEMSVYHEMGNWYISEIYVMNADGTGRTRLTNTSWLLNRSPAWSPDGSKIAFYRFPSPNSDSDSYGIYTINAAPEGPDNQAQRIVAGYEPSWSPNGTKIAFYSYARNSGTEIYVMNAAPEGPDNVPINLTSNNIRRDDHYSPAWSPDGTKISYSSIGGGTNAISAMNADGTQKIDLNISRVTGVLGSNPAWQPLPYAIPRVVKVVPGSNATGVDLGTEVKATFSEPMKAATIDGRTFKLYERASGARVGAVVRYDAVNNKAKLNPSHTLKPGTTYKAVVTTRAKDLAGNKLDKQEQWHFRTKR